MTSSTSQNTLDIARSVLIQEAEALYLLSDSLDYHFIQAVEAILACRGRIVVTGMGKSGHIAGKIAATMASTGTTAFFVHPAEAGHGDLGMILPEDCVIALSHSGESEELITILPALKRKGCFLIAMTGRADSSLAQSADVILTIPTIQEACPLGLAPTTSTTTALALGDALAVALLKARNFTKNDFALSHPAGTLGKKLLIRVDDLMHQNDELPYITQEADLQQAIIMMSEKGLGFTAICDDQHHVIGVLTDGDLRRIFQSGITSLNTPIAQLMHTNPKTIQENRLANEALHLMQVAKISALPVINEQGYLKGVLTMHDLLRSGIV